MLEAILCDAQTKATDISPPIASQSQCAGAGDRSPFPYA
jgi:hypothetical protein